ncbi:MAG: sugar ABC transporter substrate-binding protein [Anaerococcus sp.]|nr:sugar ABC transporter substrate-binding protein [Anaerococcus sp.]
MKNILKKLAILSIIALGFSGCNQNNKEVKNEEQSQSVADSTTENSKGTLYFIPIVDTGAYWSPMRKGAEETAKKLGYDLVVKTSPSNEAQKNEKHIGFINEAIENESKGIAIAPMESNIFLNPIKEAMNKDIPVITFDADLDDASSRTSYVGTDNYEAGKSLGINGAKKIKENSITEGSISIVTVDVAQPTMIKRMEGVKDGFEEELGKDAKNFKWLEPIMDKDQAAESKRQVESQITSNEDLSIIFSLGSEGPDVGVMEALSSQDKAGKILHLGFDWTPTWLKGIEDGRITAIVDQDAYTIGCEVIENLVKAVEGEEIQSEIPIEVNFVEASDLEEYGKNKEEQMADTVTE